MHKRGIMLLLVFMLLSAAQGEPLHGTVLYDNLPARNVTVTVSWLNRSNSTETAIARTFTREEADALGDRSLEGTYYIDETVVGSANITLLLDGSRITVTAEPGSMRSEASVRPEPAFYSISGIIRNIQRFFTNSTIDAYSTGEKANASFDNVTASIDEASNLSRGEMPSAKSMPEGSPPRQSSPGSANHETGQQAQQGVSYAQDTSVKSSRNPGPKINPFLILIPVAAILSGILLYRSKVLVKIKAVIEDISFDPVAGKTRKILGTRLWNISEAITELPAEASYESALAEMAKDSKGVIYITSRGRQTGCVTERDFLQRGFSGEEAVGAIAKPMGVIEAGRTVGEAIALLKEPGAGRLLLKLQDSTTGEATLEGIQRLMSGLSRHYGAGISSGLPAVREIMSRDAVMLDKKKSVEEARKTMLSRDADLIILTDEGKPAGIFTVHDYVSGLDKYKKEIVRQNVENLMSISIVTIDPDLNILEANEFMLLKEFSCYPVIVHGAVLGFLTRRSLCMELFSFLEKRAGKGP